MYSCIESGGVTEHSSAHSHNENSWFGRPFLQVMKFVNRYIMYIHSFNIPYKVDC